VVQSIGREIGDAARQLEGLRDAELERRRIVEGGGHPGDGFSNLGAAVAGIGAPHAGRSIDDVAAVDGDVVHPLGAGEQPWRLLEGAIGGERHPVCGEIVRHIDLGGGGALVKHGGLFIELGRMGVRA